MKNYLKRFFILLVCLFSVFALTACGKNEVDDVFELKTAEDLKNYSGTINIKFRVPSGTIATALNNIVPAFEAKWDGKIKVEMDVISGGYDGVLEQNVYDLNNGKAPDMTIGYPDHLAVYLSGNGLQSLTPFIENEKAEVNMEDFIQSFLPENQISDVNDDFYGLPFNKSTEVMIYNKTVFDAMGYNTPDTWDEVEEIGLQILEDVKSGALDKKLDDLTKQGLFHKSSTDKTCKEYLEKDLFCPFAYDSTDNAFITILHQWDAAYTQRETINKGYALFNNDDAVEALSYFQDLASKNVFTVAEKFEESYASNAFKALKCLMTVGSSAGVGYNLPEGDKFEIGVAPIPVKDEDHRYVISQGTNICVLSQTTNIKKAACWQLIKYLVSSEVTTKFATLTGGYLPVRMSAYDTDTYKNWINEDINLSYHYARSAAVSIQYRDYFNMFVDDAFVGSSTIRDQVGTTFSKIIVQKANIKSALEEAMNTIGPKYWKK